MHRKLPVLELEIDEETAALLQIGEILHPEHIPVGVQMVDEKPSRRSLNQWWMGRAIPASRDGLREALRLMDVSSTGLLLLKCFALSLSDHYWMNSHDKPLDWDRINFFENEFSEDVGNALFGRIPKGSSPDSLRGTSKNPLHASLRPICPSSALAHNGISPASPVMRCLDLGHIDSQSDAQAVIRCALSLISPDNTTNGWLKKKWVIDGKRRLLIKEGSSPYYQEPLNEALASIILRRLGVAHASYELAWDGERPLSVCEDFVDTTDLISVWHIYNTQKKSNNHSDYQHYLFCSQELGIPGAREGLDRMLTLDYLMVNSDRHYNNFGVVRSALDLEWVGPAPIFDTGTSMWHDLLSNRINANMDAKSKPFNSKHSAQIKHVSNFDWLDFSALQDIEDEYDALLAQSTYIDAERRHALLTALNRRIQMLQNIAERRETHGIGE
jgi:hypothetical protein